MKINAARIAQPASYFYYSGVEHFFHPRNDHFPINKKRIAIGQSLSTIDDLNYNICCRLGKKMTIGDVSLCSNDSPQL
jgi:hypothetical protein